MAARWVEEHLDLADISKKLFEQHGLRPAVIFDMTPLELMTLFSTEQDDSEELDQVAELRRLNHEVRAPKGQRPSVPSWLVKAVNRGNKRDGR
jgi:hypothetical protein